MMAKIEPGLAHLLLGQPDVSERLMRGLALKGRLPQLLAGDFASSITVEDLTSPEFDYLRRLNRAQGGGFPAAVAAQFSFVVFGRNAQSHDAIALVDQIVISNPNAGANTFFVGMLANAAAPGVGAGNEITTDDRVNGAGVFPARTLFTTGLGQNAADFHTAGMLTVALPAQSTIVLDIPFVVTNAAGPLPAGARSNLWVSCSVVNVAFACSFFWRERPLLATEL